MTEISSEKSHSIFDFFTSNAIVSRASSVISKFQEKRNDLDLPNPGNIDNISKEVERDVFLNNSSFTGMRAEITKSFSASPFFQISHALSMGSQVQPPYAFSGLYGSRRAYLQGTVDNEQSLHGRFNWRWTQALVSKSSVQLQPGSTGQNVLSVENHYTGSDFTASLKAMNPSILDGGVTGIFIGDYLQSITPKLSLGIEAMWQRVGMNQGPEMLVTYAARYKTKDWVASARLLAAGGMQTSYWRRLADKVEVGADLNLQIMPAMGAGSVMAGGPRREGIATLGAKYDFHHSSVRAQVDTTGKLSCLFDKRVVPSVMVTFVGEIDHVKNQAKVGLGVQIEMMSEEVMEEQERLGPDIPAPPF